MKRKGLLALTIVLSITLLAGYGAQVQDNESRGQNTASSAELTPVLTEPAEAQSTRLRLQHQPRLRHQHLHQQKLQHQPRLKHLHRCRQRNLNLYRQILLGRT